ncbi:MAG TPA: hypothetical protein VN799_00395 [Acidimicrobiales bacterium]|nr:hypothetical protein [Acidimicrobiales bacterium]
MFSPALQGLNSGSSAATVDASLTGCSDAGLGKISFIAGRLQGLVGSVSPGNCTSLAISHVAPPLSGGSVVWAPHAHLAGSGGISFPAGAATIIDLNRGTFLQVSYSGGSVTTGSFANSGESSMTATSTQSDAQLAGKCRSKNGLSVDDFRGTATL